MMLETETRILVWRLPIATQDLVAEYVAYQQAAGYAGDPKVRTWGARAFLQRYPDLESWRSAPLAEQLGLPRSLKYFANFLFLKHYLRPTMGYLLTAHPRLAQAGQRHLYQQVYDRFHDLGQRVGYADGVLQPTLNCLFYVMAYAGKPVELLTEEDVQTFEQQLHAYQPLEGDSFSRRTYSRHLYRVRVLLFQAGMWQKEPLRYRPKPARSREQLWVEIPEPLCQIVWQYLDQLGTVRALDTVKNIEGYLRRFFGWLARTYPEVQHVRQLTRAHIEAFKLWLHDTPCVTGRPYHRHTIKSTLSAMRCFFQAIQEWGWPDAPERPLVFASDAPTSDQPLPRFLDDAQAAALLQAARAADDLFTRVCVETLLRTGLRKGEFVRLQLDSVVKIGDTYWLRVPLGKLHNDRYIPLHPEVKRLLDEWVAQRGEGLRSNDLFVIHGRRVGVGRVDGAVKRAAKAAGLEEGVSAHRLRHTLATQAINRGMSLEAIAALLGHRSLTMTLTYARIANRTVQEQYQSVCADLDTLYAAAALSDPATPSPDLDREGDQ
jgi:site-specific recombinase XerD